MKQALFPGDSEIDQIYKIFRLFGLPDESNWKGVSKLPDYNHNFPKWEMQDIDKFITFHSKEQRDFFMVRKTRYLFL